MRLKRLFFLFSLFFLILISIRNIFKIHDSAAFIGLAIGLGGTLFSAWQIMLSSEASQEANLAKIKTEFNGEIRDIKDEFDKEIRELKIVFDKRDFYHEQQLGLLNQHLSELRAHLDNHQGILGHPEVIKEILAVKDQVADVRAQVAAIGRQGEFLLKLEQLQSKVDKLSATT